MCGLLRLAGELVRLHRDDRVAAPSALPRGIVEGARAPRSRRRPRRARPIPLLPDRPGAQRRRIAPELVSSRDPEAGSSAAGHPRTVAGSVDVTARDPQSRARAFPWSSDPPPPLLALLADRREMTR